MAVPPPLVFQFHVQLLGIEPAIWRRIQVWEDTTLSQLHVILQNLFLWEDYHLHDFLVDRKVYSTPDPEDQFYGRRVFDESRVPLNALVHRPGQSFIYNYDFGDGWAHKILLDGVLLAEPRAFYPRCLAGERSGPPEDVGGVGGYEEYLEALADPTHEEHEHWMEWRGPFEPEAFDLMAVNDALRKIFAKSRSGRTPRKKAPAAPRG